MIYTTLFKALLLGAAAVSATDLGGRDVDNTTSPLRVFKFGCKCVGSLLRAHLFVYSEVNANSTVTGPR